MKKILVILFLFKLTITFGQENGSYTQFVGTGFSVNKLDTKVNAGLSFQLNPGLLLADKNMFVGLLLGFEKYNSWSNIPFGLSFRYDLLANQFQHGAMYSGVAVGFCKIQEFKTDILSSNGNFFEINLGFLLGGGTTNWNIDFFYKNTFIKNNINETLNYNCLGARIGIVYKSVHSVFY